MNAFINKTSQDILKGHGNELGFSFYTIEIRFAKVSYTLNLSFRFFLFETVFVYVNHILGVNDYEESTKELGVHVGKTDSLNKHLRDGLTPR